MLSRSYVQRGVPLNLKRLYPDICDLKSRVLCYLNRIKLGSVESH